MQVALLVAAVVILAGVVLAALGRAGEMATFASDTAPMDTDEVSATDVALLRPPMSLWGYNAQATEDALRVIARSVSARDVEIATLRRELADLRGSTGGTKTAGAAASQPADPVAAYRRPAPPAASQLPDPVAAYRPPAASQPPATAAASEPPDPGAETVPAADPPTEDDWRPIWQRNSEPGPDD